MNTFFYSTQYSIVQLLVRLHVTFKVTFKAKRWKILRHILISRQVSVMCQKWQSCIITPFFAEEDFWFELFDAPYIKYGILGLSIFTFLCLFPTYIFIFLYIQDKRFRTVLTYGENIVYLYFYFYLCVPFCLDVIRIFSGPMSETLCWLTIFFKNFGGFGGQFGFVVCIILRYLYVIVYKSVGVFNDDFFGWFLHLLSILFSFVAAFIKLYVPGKMGLNYYMCTGEDPDPYSFQKSKVSFLHIFFAKNEVLPKLITKNIHFSFLCHY